jgi:hypothetical protein
MRTDTCVNWTKRTLSSSLAFASAFARLTLALVVFGLLLAVFVVLVVGGVVWLLYGPHWVGALCLLIAWLWTWRTTRELWDSDSGLI